MTAQSDAKAKDVVSKRALRVGYLIHDVSRLRRTVYDQRLKPMGVTRSQWWVLVNLSRHDGEGFTQIELARLLDVGKVTVGGLVDRLEENGLVKRVQDSVDRRSKRVFVSKKGEELIHVLEHEAKFINKDIMKGISTAEHKVLADILAKMKQNLIDMEAVPSSTTGRSAASKL
jgi:DNA-binding MarR family transcriptional regulator